MSSATDTTQTTPDTPAPSNAVLACLIWGGGIAAFLYLFPLETLFRVVMSAVGFDYRLSISLACGVMITGLCLASKHQTGRWKRAGEAGAIGGLLDLLLCGIEGDREVDDPGP